MHLPEDGNEYILHNLFRMTVSSELWQANQDLAQACLEHPFVALPMVHFTGKICLLCGTRCLFLDSPVHTALRQRKLLTVRDLVPSMPNWRVLEEIHLHEGYAAAWGVNLRLLNWNQQHVVILTSCYRLG